MSLTKIGSIGINTGIQFAGVTTIATLNASDNVLSVGGTVNFVSDVSIGGTVSIAGTLTYEDVTNVDAVGLITARDGIVVGSGITLSVDGDGFFTGVVTATTFSGDGSSLTGIANTGVIFTDKLHVGDSPELISVGVGSDLQLTHDATDSTINNTTGDLYIKTTGSGDDILIYSKDNIALKVHESENGVVILGDGSVQLYYDDSLKLETATGGVTVTGTQTATDFAYSSHPGVATLTGDNSTTTMTIASGHSVNSVLVVYNGVILTPTTDYTISGTTLTLQFTPPTNAQVVVRYLIK